MKIHRDVLGFSCRPLAGLMVGAALLVACGAESDPIGAHPLPDGGLRRDARPGEPPDPDGGAEPSADAGAGGTPDAAADPDAGGAATDARGLPDAASVDDAGAGGLDAGGSVPVDAGPTGGVRFGLTVTNDVPESIWVQVSDAAGQPGWLTLEHEGVRYFLAEMCELEACDGPPEGVCGAARPMVRDITGGTASGSYTLDWDGTASRASEDGRCERRGPAPAGTWKATICWGLEAAVEPGAPGAADVPGEVTRPICVERTFELPGTRAVVEVLSGG